MDMNPENASIKQPGQYRGIFAVNANDRRPLASYRNEIARRLLITIVFRRTGGCTAPGRQYLRGALLRRVRRRSRGRRAARELRRTQGDRFQVRIESPRGGERSASGIASR